MQFHCTVGTSLLDLRSTDSAFNKWCPEWSCCCKTHLRTVFTFCSDILFKLRCRDDSNIFNAWMTALRRYRHRTLLKLLIVFHLKTNKPDHWLKPYLTRCKTSDYAAFKQRSSPSFLYNWIKGACAAFRLMGSQNEPSWISRRQLWKWQRLLNCEGEKLKIILWSALCRTQEAHEKKWGAGWQIRPAQRENVIRFCFEFKIKTKSNALSYLCVYTKTQSECIMQKVAADCRRLKHGLSSCKAHLSQKTTIFRYAIVICISNDCAEVQKGTLHVFFFYLSLWTYHHPQAHIVHTLGCVLQ